MARDSDQWQRALCECGVAHPTAAKWAPHFAEQIGDSTFSMGDEELPMFLAHFLHETDMLERLEENLNYSAGRITEIGMTFKEGTRWRSAVPKAMELARNPRGFAEFMYGCRFGNDEPGDGYKYRGRGAGVTFKDNYRKVGALMGVDLVADPDQLAQPAVAIQAFVAYWESRVNDADMHDCKSVTIEVNGGTIGLKKREELTALAQQVLVA